MQTITSLEAQVLPVTKLVVRDKDEKGQNRDTSYQLVLDYNAIAKAQKQIGRDLSKLENWQQLSGPELSVVAWAAFDRFHPEVTLEQVRRWLNPAQQDDLFAMLLEQCYPGILQRLEKAAADAKAATEAASGESPGENQPNLPAPAAVPEVPVAS